MAGLPVARTTGSGNSNVPIARTELIRRNNIPITKQDIEGLEGKQMEKHTKGPWEVLDGAILCENVNQYGNFFIASVSRGDNSMTEEDKANARLIAAAPDLLTACREALDELVGMICDTNTDRFQYLADAIKKAEGEE